MTTEELSQEIYRCYGAVSRARGYFLYTKKGVRLTDLFLEDGRAVLGWHSGSAFTHMKNIISRGLTGSFRTEEKSRLEKAASELFESKRKVFAFYDKKTALETALCYSKDGTCIWKPFSQKDSSKEADAIVFCPPLPWTNAFYLLAVKEEIKAEKSIKLPFALETAITRSIYDYIAQVKIRSEKDFFLYDTYLNPYFTRRGCHLIPKVPQEKYDDFVLYCLDHKIIINPHYNGISYVPCGVDKGNFSQIKNSPFTF